MPVTPKERMQYVQSLTRLLPVMRTAAGISQEELANSVGVSRQTLSSIESGKRKMAWPTYLALVLFFLSNRSTQRIFRESEAYPEKIIGEFDGSFFEKEVSQTKISEDFLKMMGFLDEQGIHTLKTTLMLEYARCTKQSGEAVLKSFNGMDYSFDLIDSDQQRAMRSLRNIQGKKHG